MIRNIWNHREFILGMVKRDFDIRFTRSILGAAWAIADPLTMIIIYTVIFSKLMGSRLPGADNPWAYGIYLTAGLVAWEYFMEVINRSQNMFLEYGQLIKKLNFPRSAVPVIILLTSSINFVIILGIFFLFLLATGNWPGWIVLTMIPLILLQQAIAVGIGIILGSLNVFFRDVGQLTGVVLKFWFWLTPIVYPATILPDFIREKILSINMIARFIQTYQDIFVKHTMPDYMAFWPQLVLAVLVLAVGFILFMRLSDDILDEL